MRLAILVVCFNRKNLTLDALRRLFNQTGGKDLLIEAFLIDDGSGDGTADAVERHFPQVHLHRGDGSLWWVGGMRKAFSEALQRGFDAYVMFNDDTFLYPDALQRLTAAYREAARADGPVILVGSMRDAVTGEHSYGGFIRRPNGLRLDFDPVLPSADRLLPCDTMNGNFTLIPAEIAAELGNFDGAFLQKFADLDYGLRATKRGLPVRVAPGYFGTCSDNPTSGTWQDRSLPVSKRWHNLLSPKGVPVREWVLYTRRHFGWRWPLYAVSPYLRTMLGR